MRDFIVIGLGRFGASVAKNLHRFGKNVRGVDPDEDAVNACLPYLSKGVVADASVAGGGASVACGGAHAARAAAAAPDTMNCRRVILCLPDIPIPPSILHLCCG